MHRAIAVLAFLTCFVLPSLASELELVSNGEFEAALSVGWEQGVSGTALSVEHAFTIHPDFDYEVRLSSANGNGSARVWQTVALPSLNAGFSADLSSLAYDGGGAWCAAALTLTYLDDASTPLGTTVLGSTSAACPWVGGPTQHIIDTTGDWQSYWFKFSDELVNLPGLDADEVREVEITLLVTAANC